MALALAMAAPAEIASVIHATTPYGSGKYSVLFITAHDENYGPMRRSGA